MNESRTIEQRVDADKRIWLQRFYDFYWITRNKGGVIHPMGETSRWRAFKFAVHMMARRWARG